MCVFISFAFLLYVFVVVLLFCLFVLFFSCRVQAALCSVVASSPFRLEVLMYQLHMLFQICIFKLLLHFQIWGVFSCHLTKSNYKAWVLLLCILLGVTYFIGHLLVKLSNPADELKSISVQDLFKLLFFFSKT